MIVPNVLPYSLLKPPGIHTQPGVKRSRTKCFKVVSSGQEQRDIAQVLYLTEGTVKNHITRILRQLGVRDRTRWHFGHNNTCNTERPLRIGLETRQTDS